VNILETFQVFSCEKSHLLRLATNVALSALDAKVKKVTSQSNKMC